MTKRVKSWAKRKSRMDGKDGNNDDIFHEAVRVGCATVKNVFTSAARREVGGCVARRCQGVDERCPLT